ncbi:MAG: flagellar protein FlgN [Firmicutes bacterium]|nr:flagellar protein FlgN [Bacillota bacterium]
MEITNVLNTQLDVLKKLLDCLKEEKELLIKEDADALKIIVDKKMDLMKELDEIEKDRVSVCGDETLESLALNSENKEEILDIKDSYTETIVKINEMQLTNQMLTKQSLDYANSMVNIFMKNKKKGGNNTYKANGKVSSGNRASMINQYK